MAFSGGEVMLARSVDRIPRAGSLPGGYQYELKLDGYRALLKVTSGRCRIRSRRGTDLTGAFADIAAAARVQVTQDLVLDGELVIWAGTALDFSALQRRLLTRTASSRQLPTQPATFMAFDLLQLGDQDLRHLPLDQRRSQLEALMATLTPPLQLTPATTDETVAAQWARDYADAGVGIEGLVIKARAEPYVPGARRWLKYRTTTTAEAVLGAVTGSLTRPERLVLGRLDTAGTLIVAGSTYPLTAQQQRELAPLLRPATDQHPWPAELPTGRMGGWGGPGTASVVLVQPVVVVEVRTGTGYQDGLWRQQTHYLRTRPDLEVVDLPQIDSP